MDVFSATLFGAAVVAAPSWSLSWAPRFDAQREFLGQAYRPSLQTTEVVRRFDAESQAGLRHEFRDLDLPDVDGEAADTNSYVHRLTLGWQRSSDSMRLDLGVTLAVSSNALKNADDLGIEDLRPALGVQWRAGPAWVALYADDRLGRTLVYPGFEVPWQPAPSHAIRLGFPASSWRWDMLPHWQSVAAIEPDGACWRVRDKEVERSSEVCSKAWQAAWTLSWQAAGFVIVDASVGYRFESKLEYQLRDRRTVHIEVPGGRFYALRIAARL
jgi:hypothetical protein